jgi:hypothetical protein
MHLVLHSSAVPDDLAPPRHQTAQAFGLRIRNPNLRQKATGLQLRQNAGIDLIGLDPRMGDRFYPKFGS